MRQGNVLSLLVVTSALLLAPIGFGLWAAATTTDHASAQHFEMAGGHQAGATALIGRCHVWV